MTELTKSQQLAWRRFLATEPGILGMLWLRERTPTIVTGDSTAIIFQAGLNQGYVVGLNAISELLAQEPEKTNNYENP